MVEGYNEARAQWIGRTSHNKTLNFTAPETVALSPGAYAPVRVTRSFPNSLVGELEAIAISGAQSVREKMLDPGNAVV